MAEVPPKLDIELPDGSLVIRGGVNEPQNVADKALRVHDPDLGYCVSGWGGYGTTLTYLINENRVPHPFFVRTTAGRIREAGFEVLLTYQIPHCSLYLGHDLSDDVVERFVNAFNPPEPNIYLERHQ